MSRMMPLSRLKSLTIFSIEPRRLELLLPEYLSQLLIAKHLSQQALQGLRCRHTADAWTSQGHWRVGQQPTPPSEEGQCGCRGALVNRECLECSPLCSIKKRPRRKQGLPKRVSECDLVSTLRGCFESRGSQNASQSVTLFPPCEAVLKAGAPKTRLRV